MAKRKRTKAQTTIYKTLHWKLKIEHHEHHKKPGVKSGAPEGKADSCFTSGIRRGTQILIPMIKHV